jgi:ATP-dependent HslUV protease ATP-binding subunit HslU
MATEGVTLDFTPDAILRLAELATLVNERTENIGARRLHTVMERLLDDVSFRAPEMGGHTVAIDAAYVDRMLADIALSDDLSRYIL